MDTERCLGTPKKADMDDCDALVAFPFFLLPFGFVLVLSLLAFLVCSRAGREALLDPEGIGISSSAVRSMLALVVDRRRFDPDASG
jgi:hypothetical protein